MTEREQLIRDAQDAELAHMMTCRKNGCTRCEDETPPSRKVLKQLPADPHGGYIGEV